MKTNEEIIEKILKEVSNSKYVISQEYLKEKLEKVIQEAQKENKGLDYIHRMNYDAYINEIDRLKQQLEEKDKEFLEKIEASKIRLGKILIANSKCKCLEWTDRYRGMSDIIFEELKNQIQKGEEKK